MRDAKTLAARHVMNTYRRLPVTFVKGEGAYLLDDEGRRYLDLVAGIAVVSIGHSHPRVAEAVEAQIRSLTHVSNLYFTEPMARLADKLCDLLQWPDGRVFFCNSGAEANECAIKLVRKWGREASTDKYVTVATLGSFHGRTLETLAATGQPAKWEPFVPLPPGFRHVPYDDNEAIAAAVQADTAAILVEPIQGEGGINVPSDGYFPFVRSLCSERSVAFVDDEVQTGLGRTGRWFGFQHWGAPPDVITLAKALGNGLPIGACIARGEFAEALGPGDHATTIGGGPVVCAAAEAVLDVMEEEGLAENAAAMGAHLKSALEGIGPDLVESVRGKGLLLAVQLKEEVARQVVVAALGEGLLVNDVSPSAIRICPPLNITAKQCDEAVSKLGAAIESVRSKVVAR